MSKNTKCLNISNSTTNVIDSNTEALKQETLHFLKECLVKSLGPYGSTTIIRDALMNHKITKDGYTILNNIYIDSEEQRTILDLVKKISRRLVRKVGDGSTSAIVIADALYTELNGFIEDCKNKGTIISSREILKILDHFSKMASKELMKRAIKIDEHNVNKVKDIAAIALNNDEANGQLIADLYKQITPYGFITLERSPNENTYYEISRGFEVHMGFLSVAMTNTQSRKQCIQNDPYVLMIDDILTMQNINVLQGVLQTYVIEQGRPMTIIAPGFSDDIAFFFNQNIGVMRQNKTPFEILAVTLPYSTPQDKEDFNELALFLGATPSRLSENESFCVQESSFGMCQKLICDSRNTKFIKGSGNPAEIKRFTDSLEEQKQELAKTETYIQLDKEIARYNRRINRLSNSMATLYIGGETEDEKETKLYLFEDAVFACKSAFNYGYNIGGNLAIPFIFQDSTNTEALIEEIYNDTEILDGIVDPKAKREFIKRFITTIVRAFLKSFASVLGNYYLHDPIKVNSIIGNSLDNSTIPNLKTHKDESIEESNVINSAETDIEICKACFSIIGLLFTSNQIFILNTDLR